MFSCDPFCMKKMPLRRQFALAVVLGVALPTANSSVVLRHMRVAGVAFDVIPECRLPAGVVSHLNEKDMPAVLRNAIKQKLGYLVPPNVPFDATDLVMTGHNRRLIFIWVRDNTWVVATEHGGIGYNDPILAYRIDPDGQQVKLLAERIAFPNTVCSIAGELLKQPSTIVPSP
jgi:hypothetical protein